MRFNVSRDSFYEAVTVVSKACSTNGTLPILLGIKLTASDGILYLQSTDLITSIKHSTAALVEESGDIVVSGKVLQDILKNLPDAAVMVELQGNVLKITCEKSTFKINTLDPIDFPTFPELNIEKQIELPSKILIELVNKVRKAAATDKTRAILTGILLSMDNNIIRLVSTDSYRLAVAETSYETSQAIDEFELIVPANSFYEAISLAGQTDKFSLSVAENQILFSIGQTIYVTQRIEGNFPNYKQLLPKDKNTVISININELIAALKRVAVLAQKTTPIKFSISNEEQELTLVSKSAEQGGAVEKIPCSVEGEDLEIAFNHQYILDGLNVKGSSNEVVDIELQSSLKPGIFKMHSDIEYLYLIMPVRMN